MAKLHTLTVPDVLWINLQVTGSPQAYDYATLEESTFNQYSRGKNDDLAGQATRFLTGFVKLAPFTGGNLETAAVGCLAFLRMNGKSLDVARQTLDEWATDPARAKIELPDHMVDWHGHDSYGVPDTRGIVDGVLAEDSVTAA